MTHPLIHDDASLILDEATIARKMLRMAYEIYENNAAEEEIILAGIADRGSTVAQVLRSNLQSITPFRITLAEIALNKSRPLDASIKKEIACNGKCIIVVDDVANSGRTMFYAMRSFMTNLPKKIQTAVLVDRMHKSFPVSVDYTGYRLSTTLHENVVVEIEGDQLKGAYLE